MKLFEGAYIHPSIQTFTFSTMDVQHKNDSHTLLSGTRDKFSVNHITDSDTEIIVTKTSTGALLVDGTIAMKKNGTLILFQFKYKTYASSTKEDSFSQKEDNPFEWYNDISKIKKKKSKNMKFYQNVIYVFVTNANIPKKAKEMMEMQGDIPIIIIDQSISKEFYSPNIYPYVQSIPKFQH
jgi:activator of 2-hydroxyglutaryl-CoA dehydratase